MPDRVVRVEHIMGTAIGVDVRDENVGKSVLDEFFSWLRDVDARFSTYKSESEISRLSRGEIMFVDASPDVRHVLDLCEDLRLKTNGAFDVWRHRADGALDPSALVKGWSLQRGAQMLADAGLRNFCINGGGDVIARGRPYPDRAWRVGIRHPDLTGGVAAVVVADNLAVATSGLYERGDHILNPQTNRAPAGLLSITIAGPSLTFADAYATAAFAMGADGVAWASTLDGYAAYAITSERRCQWSDAFTPLLAPST